MGEIENLLNEPNQQSTGLVESHTVLVKVAEEKSITNATALILQSDSESMWKSEPSDNIDDKLRFLCQIIFEACTMNTRSVQALDDESVSIEESSEKPKHDSANDQSRESLLSIDLKEPQSKKTHGKEPAKKTQFSSSSIMKVKKAIQAFNELMNSNTGRNELIGLLEKKTIFLNMVDTGGQPAFIEMLPALIIGPAMYLIFFQLNKNLNEQFNIMFLGQSEIKLGESCCTVEEIIFQVISSIAYLRSATQMDQESIFSSSSLAVMFFGTYKDEVETSKIKDTDDALQKHLKDLLHKNNLFKIEQDSICYARPSESEQSKQLIFDVNNKSGTLEEVKIICKRLEEVMQRFQQNPIPSSWLMFSLCLRLMKEKILNKSDCVPIASELGISDDFVDSVLFFLHHTVKTRVW